MVEPARGAVSIDEAKQQYEAWAKATVPKADKINKRKPVWGSSKLVKLKDGSVAVETPVLYNWSRQFCSLPFKFSDQGSIRLSIQAYLITFRDKEGNIQANLLTLLPEASYQQLGNQANPDKFMGTLIRRTLDEQIIIDAWRCSNGKAVSKLDLVSDQADKNEYRQPNRANVYEVWSVIDKLTFDKARSQKANCAVVTCSGSVDSIRHENGIGYYRCIGNFTF